MQIFIEKSEGSESAGIESKLKGNIYQKNL